MNLVPPKWDLSGFFEVESDYWEVETLAGAEEGERVGSPPAEGVGETRTMNAMTEGTMVMVEDDPLA